MSKTGFFVKSFNESLRPLQEAKIMNANQLKKYKNDIRSGLIAYMKAKAPGKSQSTYKTYVTDSFYLLNNDLADEYFRFMRNETTVSDVISPIKEKLIERRGEEKVTDWVLEYYTEKLSWHREYVQSIGGVDSLLKDSAK